MGYYDNIYKQNNSKIKFINNPFAKMLSRQHFLLYNNVSITTRTQYSCENQKTYGQIFSLPWDLKRFLAICPEGLYYNYAEFRNNYS